MDFNVDVRTGGFIIRNLKKFFTSGPTLSDVTSQLCTASQFHESVYNHWLTVIDQQFKYHRKQWEYVYILQVLKKYDLLRSGVKGLGFGCGKEPLVAAMATYGCDIMATDIELPIDSGDDYWGAGSVSDLFFPGVCPEDVFQQRVSFMFADMNQIPDNLFAGYDFLWSCCALEHLGSLAAGINFILNSSECLKPGGIAVHTTEYNLTKGDSTLETRDNSLFRRQDIQNLEKQLEQIGCSMLPCNWHSGNLPEDKHIDLPPYKQDIHLKLRIEQFDVTSLGLVIRKRESGAPR